MKIFRTLCLFLLLPHFLFSQVQNQPAFGCASDEAQQALFLAQPEKMAQQEALEQLIFEKLNSPQHAPLMPVTLPVVVHIIHQNGPENISDAQVELAIEQLNQAFAHEGYYAQQGNGHNTLIQFCLARRTPDGLLTNGINRVDNPLTTMTMETDDIPMKDLSRWNPLEYVNIWVVGEILSQSSGSGVAGYAYFPSSHGGPEDGLVCEAQFFGSGPAENAVLIHEMGHYLNLYHTFQGGCPNANCLSDGDRVCDTPPDQATHSACIFNSCDTDADDPSPNNPLTTDVDDLTENYMDYSPFDCYHAFTPGQADRMHAAIETARSSLLDSPGCLDPCDNPVTADFTASALEIFAGETVNFTDLSPGATVYEWSVDGVPFAATANANFTFNDIGIFEVELFVSNSDPNCQDRFSIFIEVLCPVVADFTPNATELEIGDPFVGTNISQNATSQEWFINGVSVGTTLDLNYTFSNAGFYTVTLQVVGDNCNDSYSVVVEVLSDNPCQDSVTGKFFQLTGTGSNQSWLRFEDMGLDGSIFFRAVVWQMPGQGDGIVFKLAPDGSVLWKKKIQSGGNAVESIIATPDGGCLVHFEETDWQIRKILKLDAGGNTEWLRDVETDNDSSEYTFFSFDGKCLLLDEDLNTPMTVTGFDEDGTALWNTAFEFTDGFETGVDVTMSNDNASIWIAGHANPGLQAVVIKMDWVGNILFARQFSDASGNKFSFRHIDATPDGGFIATGTRQNGTNLSDRDFLICKGDADGTLAWSKVVANPESESSLWGVISKPDGSGFIASYFSSPLGFQWLTFSNVGDLEAVNQYLWDTGQNVDMELLDFGGQMFAEGWRPTSNNESYLTNFHPELGPSMGCTEKSESIFTAEDVALVQADYEFQMVPSSNVIADGSMTELPPMEDIVLLPFCSTTPFPCPEICDNGLDDDGDGYVDCYDVDCDCSNGEDCEADPPPSQPIEAAVSWMSPEDLNDVLSSPIVANLDPQNGPIPEIIVPKGVGLGMGLSDATDMIIFQGDGSNIASPEEQPIEQGMYYIGPAAAIGDIDSDGIPEMVQVCGDRRVRVYRDYTPGATPPMELWMTSTGVQVQHKSSHASLADFDADGVPEVYSENRIFKFDLNANTLTGILQGSAHRGNSANVASGSTVAADVLSVADCNGDPDCEGLELIAGANIYSVDMDPFDGDGMQMTIQRDLNVMDPGQGYEDGYTFVADLNLDGTMDIVTVGGNDNSLGLYAWDKNGLLQFFVHQPQVVSTAQFTTVAIGNVFDDTSQGFAQDFPEIISSEFNRINCFNLNKASSTPNDPTWWWLPIFDTGRSGASVFDLDGDGFHEIFYRDERDFKLMYGGPAPFPAGVDAQRNWFTTDCFSITYQESPTIADIDADGEAEVVFCGRTFANGGERRGRLWAVESIAAPWLPARDLWNQYKYFGVNVNNDLTIPAQQQAHHLEFPGLGSGKRPFNLAIGQIPIVDENFDPYYPVTDAVVLLDSSQCEADSIRLWLTVCNQGSAILPEGTPIASYDGDPTTPAATPLGLPVLTTAAIEIDSCLLVEMVIPAVYNSQIFVLVNDDQTLPPPFDLASDFPVTDIPECDFENNLTALEIPYLNPSLDLGPDIVLCNSSVVELNAGSGFTDYEWQDGSPDSTFTAYLPGSYWVTVLDGCGFPISDTVEIILNQADLIDLGPDQSLCPGGSLNLSVSGFDEVSWWPEEGLDCTDCASVTASPNDTVTYYVTGSIGDCFSTDSIQILIEELEISLQAENASCDTFATLSVTAEGNGPFSYEWSNGGMDSVTTVSQSGFYEVTITTADGCEAIDSVEAEIDLVLAVDTLVTHIDCFGDSTGAIDLTPQGGTPPFDFLWENGAVMEDLSDLPAGIYEVTVTDSEGCQAELQFELTEPTEIEITSTVTDLPCPTDTGMISLQISGGISPYDIGWPNDSTTASIEILQAGNYAATITDGNGCEVIHEEEVAVLGTFPQVDLTTDTLTCDSLTALILAETNVAGATYSWSGPGGFSSVQPSANVNLPGSYSVTVTDPAGGCDAVEMLTVEIDTLPPVALISADTSTIPCDAPTVTIDGSSSSQGTGFSFEWSPTSGISGGGNSLTPQVNEAGNYLLTVTDEANGCTATDAISIGASEAPTAADIAVDSVDCFGEMNGGLEIFQVFGGTPPYSYSLDGQPVTTDFLFENLAAGTYTLQVFDVDACQWQTTIEIGEPAPLSVTLQGDTLVNADEPFTVEAIVSPLDALLDQIIWQPDGLPEQLAVNVMLTDPTLFTIEIVDENGCRATDELQVQVVRPSQDVYFPNVFHPNSPTDVNARFTGFGGEAIANIRSLKIFDRWGGMVFDAENLPPNDTTAGWDGTHDGEPVNLGVYIFLAEVEFSDGGSVQVSGEVTVVR